MELKQIDDRERRIIKKFSLQDGTIIFVYQGKLGKNPDLDIVIKFQDKYAKRGPRTPKHIHWVIDILLKKQSNKQLTINFLKELLYIYEKIEPFKNKEEQQLCDLKLNRLINLVKYEELNQYGQYSVEFLVHIMELLSIEEKTGFEGAFMFKSVIKALLEKEDIFAIVSAATFRGRL